MRVLISFGLVAIYVYWPHHFDIPDRSQPKPATEQPSRSAAAPAPLPAQPAPVSAAGRPKPQQQEESRDAANTVVLHARSTPAPTAIDPQQNYLLVYRFGSEITFPGQLKYARFPGVSRVPVLDVQQNIIVQGAPEPDERSRYLQLILDPEAALLFKEHIGEPVTVIGTLVYSDDPHQLAILIMPSNIELGNTFSPKPR